MKFELRTVLHFWVSRYMKRLLPSERADFLMKMIHSSVEQDPPAESLKILFDLDNRIYSLAGKTSVSYGNGFHTKHRHINYHQYFIDNLKEGERVLDIGSGNGLLSYKMASEVDGVEVVGIEWDDGNIRFANEHYPCHNLRFIHGDATKDLPEEEFDVVTMSNVLEHISQRVKLLKTIIAHVNPERFIIRVPHFERDWRVPLKKELGVDYRLDATHQIEYTREEFLNELKEAGLCMVDVEFRWGEIWSVSKPR